MDLLLDDVALPEMLVFDGQTGEGRRAIDAQAPVFELWWEVAQSRGIPRVSNALLVALQPLLHVAFDLGDLGNAPPRAAKTPCASASGSVEREAALVLQHMRRLVDLRLGLEGDGAVVLVGGFADTQKLKRARTE